MRRRSGTLDEGRSGFNGGGCAGGRCAGARAGTDARGVPQGVLRGRAGGAGAPAVGRRAGVRAGGRAQPMARRESTTPQHVGARGVPQGGGLAARLRLRKDEEEDAMPQRSPGRAESRCQLAEITGRIQSCGEHKFKENEKRALWALQRKHGAHRFHRGLWFGWPATCTDGMLAHVAIFIRIVGLTKRLVSWILTQFPPNFCPECIL